MTMAQAYLSESGEHRACWRAGKRSQLTRQHPILACPANVLLMQCATFDSSWRLVQCELVEI